MKMRENTRKCNGIIGWKAMEIAGRVESTWILSSNYSQQRMSALAPMCALHYSTAGMLILLLSSLGLFPFRLFNSLRCTRTHVFIYFPLAFPLYMYVFMHPLSPHFHFQSPRSIPAFRALERLVCGDRQCASNLHTSKDVFYGRMQPDFVNGVFLPCRRVRTLKLGLTLMLFALLMCTSIKTKVCGQY